MITGDKVYALDCSNNKIRIGYYVGDIFKTGFQPVISIESSIVSKINDKTFDIYRNKLFFAYSSRVFIFRKGKYKKYRNTLSYFLKNTKSFLDRVDYPDFFDSILDNTYKFGRNGLWLSIWGKQAWIITSSIIKTLLELVFLPLTLIYNYITLNIETKNLIAKTHKERDVLKKRESIRLSKDELEYTKKIIAELEEKRKNINNEKKDLKNIFIAILLPILAAIIPLVIQKNSDSKNIHDSNMSIISNLGNINNSIEDLSDKIEHFDRNIDFHLEDK